MLLQCTLLLRCVKLKQDSTPYLISVPVVMESLCWARDGIIVLGNFNAVTGTEMAGYEICVGPYGSSTRNYNSSFLLNIAKYRRLRIVDSWYQRPGLHHRTWCSNAKGMVKEIDFVLVSSWRILQNHRVIWSPEFFANDHRLVVATLKLHVKLRKPPRCHCTVSS